MKYRRQQEHEKGVAMSRHFICGAVLILLCLMVSGGFAQMDPAVRVAPQGARTAGQSAVQLSPDLVAGSITFLAITDRNPRYYDFLYLIGEQGEITITIVNNGPGSIAYVPFRVSVNGQPVQSSGLMNIGPGQVRTNKIPFSFHQTGRQNLLLEVDPGNTIRESNKNNNTTTSTVQVTADPSDPRLLNSRNIGEGKATGGGGGGIRPSGGM